MEFTKITDKNDLIKLLTQLQTEKILLQSSISEHSIKCQSVLDSCKNKFSQVGCETTHNIKKQELEETIKTTQQTIKDNQDILADLHKLILNTKKDCKDIKEFYYKSKEKLNQDDKRIKGIKTQVKDSLHILNTQKEHIVINSTNANLRINKSDNKTSISQVKNSSDPVIRKSLVNVIKTNNQYQSSNVTNLSRPINNTVPNSISQVKTGINKTSN